MNRFYQVLVFLLIFFGSMWKTADLLADKLIKYSIDHYTSEIESGNYNVFEQSVYYKYYDNTTSYEVTEYYDISAQVYIGQIQKQGRLINSYEFKLFSDDIDLTDEITIKMTCSTTTQIEFVYEERYTNEYNKNIIGVYLDEVYVDGLNCPTDEKVTVSISNNKNGNLLEVNQLEPRFTEEMTSNIDTLGELGYTNKEYNQHFVKDARPLNILIVPTITTGISILLYKFIYIDRIKNK